MTWSLIVAVAENMVIGRKGQLPWRLSADLRRFKKLTMGHAIVMGRKTYESIGRPLPGRQMFVVTRQRDYIAAGAQICNSLDEARKAVEESGDEEAFIIGGAELYRQAIPFVDRIYVTVVHDEYEGDAYFPEIDWKGWRCVSAEPFYADSRNDCAYSFETHERKK